MAQMISRITRGWWLGGLMAAALAMGLAPRPARADVVAATNNHLGIVVDLDSSRFTVIRGLGDPNTMADDGLAMIYPDAPNSAKATLYVSSATDPNGATTAIIGSDDGDVLQPPTVRDNGATIESRWAYPKADD